LGANPGKRKREGMLEFLRGVETAGLDEALKLNIEDKEDSSPRRPPAKRVRPAEEQTSPAVPVESSPEASSRPKRKAAPPPATEAPVKGRGKKAKTDAAPSTAAAPPASKGKKSGAEKKAAGKADEEAAAREQQEADEVDALADEPAENGAADSADQGAPEGPNAPGPNVPTTVIIETTQVEAVITSA
jgi:hypothetical protein